MRVLVVEDDRKLRDVLCRGLSRQGFSTAVVANGSDAVWQATEFDFDAIVLDVLLPDLSGFAVCAQLRAADRWAPILMLTALDGVEDRIRGLDVGADDYLVKPFHLAELSARLRALLRRGPAQRPAVLRVGDLSLDPASRVVKRGAAVIALTAREFGLLEFFMRNRDRVLTRTTLVEHVWDEAFDGDLHVVNVYIAYVRDKIDKPFGRNSLQTVRGTGYRLVDELAQVVD
jgi:two-component system OmpR family response regulator